MTAGRSDLLKGLALFALAAFAGWGSAGVYAGIVVTRFYHHTVRAYDVVELAILLVVMLGALAGAVRFLFRALRPRRSG